MKLKKRILIISPQGIGDLVMLLPCLRILEFNNITFDILVKDRSSRDFIDELNFHNLYNIFILKEHLYKLIFYKYNLIIPQCTVSKYKFILLSLLLKKYNYSKMGYKILSNTQESIEHNTIKNLKLFKFFLPNSFNIDLDDFKKEYYLKFKKRITSNLILVAPGGGWRESHKHLSPHLIAKLINTLHAHINSLNFIILGGIDNKILANHIIFEIQKINKSVNIKSLAGETDFCQLFDLIQESKIVITACNGISHISGMLGADIYGFYGPTNPIVTGPYTSRFHYMTTDLKCGPCYSKLYPYGCGNPICMDNFKIEIAANDIIGVIKNE